MYLEPAKKQPSPPDDTSLEIRLVILAGICILLFGILGFRLWFLQILTGDQYATAANNNRIRTVSIEAPRGPIYDRNGKALVTNRGGINVGVLPMDLRDEKDVIPRLAGVLGMTLSDLQKKLAEAKKDPYRVTTVKEDVPQDPVVAYLKEHSLEFPGVTVQTAFLRSYPAGDLAAHLLGYVGQISETDLAKEQFRTLKPGAHVGKDGVEATYDEFLRGTDGTRQVEVDAAGQPKRDISSVDPLPGNNLVLTIDRDLQQAAEKAVQEGIRRAHADGFTKASGGAVVALDPRNGQVLALASYPTYDPNLWAGGMSQADFARLNSLDAHNPLLDRAIDGLYPAGSTFKPFVAATALSNNLVTPASTFTCTGNFHLGGQRWKCWQPGGHGEVSLIKALTESCDTYFYNLGSAFYSQKGPVLQTGLRSFGFGGSTGVDLPSESIGRVPDSVWKKKWGKTAQDQAWRPGDEVNLAVGQGDLLVTPLQLATAFSAIANAQVNKNLNGTAGLAQMRVPVPHLAMSVTDSSGNIVHEFDTETRTTITMDGQDLAAIRQGLLGVTSDPAGTAYSAFRGFPTLSRGRRGRPRSRLGTTTRGSWGTLPPTIPRSWWSLWSNRAGTAAR